MRIYFQKQDTSHRFVTSYTYVFGKKPKINQKLASPVSSANIGYKKSSETRKITICKKEYIKRKMYFFTN